MTLDRDRVIARVEISNMARLSPDIRCGSFVPIHGRPSMLKLRAVIVCVLLACAACHRNDAARASFVQSLRCGMTRSEVTRLAHERGYSDSDASWLARSTSDQAKKSKELQLLDLTFRGDRLVAFREGKYDPRTKRVEFRTIELCR